MAETQQLLDACHTKRQHADETEITAYVLEHYGTCDRDQPKRNDCYWGKDSAGRENGCLKTGWRGRNCPYWRPVTGEHLTALIAIHRIKS